MKNNNVNFFVKLLVVVIIVFCGINIAQLRSTYQSILDNEEALESQRTEYLDEIDRLNEELEAEMDKDYIVRIAREKLDYYLPDEILFYSDR